MIIEERRMRPILPSARPRRAGIHELATPGSQRTLRNRVQAGGMSAGRVLVVDDEENISFLVGSALRHHGFEVATAADGRAALARAKQFAPDLVVLDVMLPDLDGFDVLKRLRLDGVDVPVLFLTARDATDDKVRGLTIGGDDYVTKPFSLEEVVARIQAILRRDGRTASPSRLMLADLELDDDAHTVRRAGELVDLSPTEYKLLRFLLLNAGRVLSRTQILQHVWEYDFAGNATVVETYVSYLRKKLDTAEPRLIHTVRGVGYTLRVR
jgi:two-component system OmpR family response regulator